MVNYYNIPVVPGIDDGNAQEEECTCEKVHWVTDPAFFGQSEVLDCLLWSFYENMLHQDIFPDFVWLYQSDLF